MVEKYFFQFLCRWSFLQQVCTACHKQTQCVWLQWCNTTYWRPSASSLWLIRSFYQKPVYRYDQFSPDIAVSFPAILLCAYKCTATVRRVGLNPPRWAHHTFCSMVSCGGPSLALCCIIIIIRMSGVSQREHMVSGTQCQDQASGVNLNQTTSVGAICDWLKSHCFCMQQHKSI